MLSRINSNCSNLLGLPSSIHIIFSFCSICFSCTRMIDQLYLGPANERYVRSTIPGGRGRGTLQYLKVVGNFPVIDACFWHFPIQLGAHFMAQLNPINPLFLQKKNGLSISHLVPKIIWLKVGLMFNQNLSFGSFWSFCTKFLLDFQTWWPSFSLFWDTFLILTKS